MNRERLDSFIDNFLYKSKQISPGETSWKEPLLSPDVLDSLTLVLLVNEIEMEYEIKVPPSHITNENFGTKESIFNTLCKLEP